MEAIILGSGGMMPMPRRHLCSMALRFKSTGEILVFDAGEGTQLAFRKVGLSVLKVTHLFVTHTHADHVTGIFGLIMFIAQSPRTEPLSLLGPPNLARFMKGFEAIESHTRFPLPVKEFTEEGCVLTTSGYRVDAKVLRHSRLCLGYAVKEHDRLGRFDAAKASELGVPEGPIRARLHRGETVELPDGRQIEPSQVVGPVRPGRKVVFMTDTLPCPQAVELADSADLLVTEGMFLEELKGHARRKWHSTVKQAARLAKKAQAKRLVITHLSPRYLHKDLGRFEEEARSVFPEAIVARDGMMIEISGD